MSAKVTVEEVERVAELAHLELAREEKPAVTSRRGRGQRPSASSYMPVFHRAAN